MQPAYIVRAGTRSHEHIAQAISSGQDTVQVHVRDADTLKLHPQSIRAAPAPTTPSPAPSPGSSSSLAAAVTKNVQDAQAAVQSELSLAKWSYAGTVALAGITVVAAGGAVAFSNIAGVATTAIAGGSGTAGLGASLKSSIASYRTLRSQASAKVGKMQADLLVALKPPVNEQKLGDVQKQVDDFYDWLASQS